MKSIKVRLKAGKYYRDGVRYVKGDLVEFNSVFDIPDTFRDGFEMPAPSRVAIDESPEEPEGPPEPKFKVVHRARGRYNVVSTETGVPINDELLSKEDAQALVGVQGQGNEPEDKEED